MMDVNEARGESGGADEVGNSAEEAARLLDAFSDWARHRAPGLGAGLSDLAGQVADSATGAGAHDHLATGNAECTWCPVCRAVRAVRQTNPEVRAHLASAASSLLAAAAGLLATPVPTPQAAGPPDGPARRGRGPVEHLDLDADRPEEDE